MRGGAFGASMCAVLLSSSPAPDLVPLSDEEGVAPKPQPAGQQDRVQGHAKHTPLRGRRQATTVAGLATALESGHRRTHHSAGQQRSAARWQAEVGAQWTDIRPRAAGWVSGPRRGAALSAGPGVQPQPSNLRRGPPRSGSIREGAACQRQAGRRPSRQGQPTPRSAVAGGRAKPSRPQAGRRG